METVTVTSKVRRNLRGIILSALLLSNPVHAKDFSNFQVDFSLGYASKTFLTSLAANYYFDFGTDDWNLGVGGRLTGYFGGSNREYTTADADLIAAGTTNSLFIGTPRTYSINLDLHFRYQIVKRLWFGANLDVIGLSFGSSVTGRYVPTDSSLSGTQTASPTSFNLFLGGRPDKGQLNSEFYLGYELSESVLLRAGFSHSFSEYTTDNTLDNNNRRFRITNDVGFLGVSFGI